jgi:hypothetical protein
MRRFAIALTPCLIFLGFGCASDPEEPNAFMTQGYTTQQGQETDTGMGSADTDVPMDMPSGDGDGDGDPGDGDGDTTATGDGDGDGDGDPTTTTTGDPMCGNGIIDDGEQCDGGNLGGFSCTDLGYTGGTLACDPITCTYDASGCVTDSDGGGTTG